MNFAHKTKGLFVLLSLASCGQPPDSTFDVTSQDITATCRWTQISSPNLGASDNSLSGVAGEKSTSVWAVGSVVPDNNPDITATLVNHFDGHKWVTVPSPNVGTEANSFNSVATVGGQAWAVGFYIDSSQFVTRSLVEHWDGSRWSVVNHPQPGVSNMLSAVSAVSVNDVWAVGFQTNSAGVFETLTEHFNGSQWSVVPGPDPGILGNQLYGVTALAADDVWAVGGRVDSAAPDSALIAHWTGTTWAVVPSPGDDTLSTNLFAVAGFAGSANTWAVGDAHSNLSGSRALIEEERHSDEWKIPPVPSVGSTTTIYMGSLSSPRRPGGLWGRSSIQMETWRRSS